MKIISCNVNGVRAASKKGLLTFIAKENPDIACFQEIKANKKQLNPQLIKPRGYYSYFNSADKKGYSGVLVYSKTKPVSVKRELGMKIFDSEGRMLGLKYKNFTLINLYLPHGGRKKEKLGYKLNVYKKLLRKLKNDCNKNLILVGDFNIAHTEIDLARPKENKNNIMFTPKERGQIDKIISIGFVDCFRQFNHKSGNYTWWSYAFKAKKRNIGWRIDYSFAVKNLSKNIKNVMIYSKANLSDHCPIGLEW